MNNGIIKAVLIDLSGTLHIDDDPTPNAIVALQKYFELIFIHLFYDLYMRIEF